MNNIVEVENLTKKYNKKRALDGLNLNIEEGKILGILGPNGSGKTTLMKILAGIMHETEGEVRIDGMKPGKETKEIVSFLPDRNFLYNWMSVEDSLKYYDDFFQDFNKDKAYDLLDIMDVNHSLKTKELSKGMVEKLNLTLVLSRDARLFILDEPIAGVDPVGRDQILDTIISSYNEESTMIITTHLVKDMENIFENIVFLKDGKNHMEGNAEDLREEYGMQIDGLYKKVFAR